MAEKYSKDMTPEEKAARRKERMDELQTQREAVALQRALSRAASDPKYNFTQRPEGFIDEGNKVIRYYSWTGGKTTGSWVAREAPLTTDNYNKYKNLMPAAEYSVLDIKARPSSTEKGAQGFVVRDGKIETKGNVDVSVLGVKSDLDLEKILGKGKAREDAALTAALERAQKSPLTNFMLRPAGRVTEDKIYFYNWVGGKDSGQWYLYETEKNEQNLNRYATKITEQAYFKPTSIRDTLIPVTNVFGENWNTVKSKKKVVPEFNPENTAKITLTGQIER